MRFKINDIIKCVRSDSHTNISNETVYTVINYGNSSAGVGIINDKHVHAEYFADRFILVQSGCGASTNCSSTGACTGSCSSNAATKEPEQPCVCKDYKNHDTNCWHYNRYSKTKGRIW